MFFQSSYANACMVRSPSQSTLLLQLAMALSTTSRTCGVPTTTQPPPWFPTAYPRAPPPRRPGLAPSRTAGPGRVTTPAKVSRWAPPRPPARAAGRLPPGWAPPTATATSARAAADPRRGQRTAASRAVARGRSTARTLPARSSAPRPASPAAAGPAASTRPKM